MRKHKVIAAGDKVEMFENEQVIYKTVIWEVLGEGQFFVAVPSHRGMQMLLHVGDELNMAFFRDSGRYVTRVRAMGFITRDKVRYAQLMQISDIEKNQRRDNFRVAVRLRAQVHKYADYYAKELPAHDEITKENSLEMAEIKDISASGVAIMARGEFIPGEKYMLKLFFDTPREKAQPMLVCCEVARVTSEAETKSFNVGMSFINQTKQMSKFLTKYVQNQQRRQIAQRRLIEDE